MENEKLLLKIGSILETNEDCDVETVEGETVHIKKGEPAIVGFDKMIYYVQHHLIEEAADDIVIDGFSSKGLSAYLTLYLKHHMGLKVKHGDYSMLQSYINEALVELGLEDDLNVEEMTEKDNQEESND